jgi:hypothetical protein
MEILLPPVWNKKNPGKLSGALDYPHINGMNSFSHPDYHCRYWNPP